MFVIAEISNFPVDEIEKFLVKFFERHLDSGDKVVGHDQAGFFAGFLVGHRPVGVWGLGVEVDWEVSSRWIADGGWLLVCGGWDGWFDLAMVFLVEVVSIDFF